MRSLLFFLCLVVATPVWAAASRSFDGTNDEIAFGNNLNVTTNSVSECTWAKMTESAAGDWLGGKKNSGGGTTDAGYGLRQQSGDPMDFRIHDATDSGVCSGTTDVDGAWYHFCGTWDVTPFTCNIYVNEVLEGTTTNTAVGSLSNAVAYKMGEDVLNAGDMSGLMAYQSVYLSKVLTTVEISQVRWRPGSLGVENSFWPLWGDSTEIDLSGNGLTGNVTGASTSTDGPPVMIGDAPL